MKKIIQKTSLFLSLFILALCFGFVLQAWTGPVSAPPADNLPQPINISSTDQVKAGRFSATEFYDADDANFYINPAGASKISGNLSLGGNLVDITNSKTIYDATTGKISPLVMPYKKGAITSDWATTTYTAGYYDVSNLSAGNVAGGVGYGRGQTGTRSPFLQSAGLPSYRTGDDGWWADASRKGVTYVNNGDGTVTASSGLMWWRCSQGQSGSTCATGSATTHSWNVAIDTCHASTLAGYTDWRLPTLGELYSLLTGTSSPRINTTAFPNSAAGSYWSSSTNLYTTSNAWFVNFGYGNVNNYNKTSTNGVRCVRG